MENVLAVEILSQEAPDRRRRAARSKPTSSSVKMVSVSAKKSLRSLRLVQDAMVILGEKMSTLGLEQQKAYLGLVEQAHLKKRPDGGWEAVIAPAMPAFVEHSNTKAARVQVLSGAHLGPERLSYEDGLERLQLAAGATPVEVWAGEVAGPTEIGERFHIARSTLHSWHAAGHVIGIRTGTRKNVFPLDQFIDGRPIDGLTEVIHAIGDQPRTAWLWLQTARPALLKGRQPLSVLKEGRISEVVKAALQDFV